MTLTNWVEVAAIAIIIIVAVRFFMKRGWWSISTRESPTLSRSFAAGASKLQLSLPPLHRHLPSASSFAQSRHSGHPPVPGLRSWSSIFLPSSHFVLSWCTVSPERAEYHGHTWGILHPRFESCARCFSLSKLKSGWLLLRNDDHPRKNFYQPYLTSGRRFLTCSISDPHRGCWDRTSISSRIVDRSLDQTPATRRECARDNPDWGRALYRESRSRDRMVCIRHRWIHRERNGYLYKGPAVWHERALKTFDFLPFILQWFGTQHPEASLKLRRARRRRVTGVWSVAWRNRSYSHLWAANAEIRTGADRSSLFRRRLPSSKNSCEGWDSPGKRAEVPLIYESGASGTETGATSRNGCLTLGILKWIHCLGLSAAEKCNRPAAIRPRVSLFPTISYQRPRQPHDLAVARNKRKRRPGTTLVW